MCVSVSVCACACVRASASDLHCIALHCSGQCNPLFTFTFST